MREFKIGDEVISKRHGKGTVIDIDLQDSVYPIKVTFDSNIDDWNWYTAEGYAEKCNYWDTRKADNRDIKHINNEITMKCTTKAEVFEQLARVSKLIEGTDLTIVNVVKYKGVSLSELTRVMNSKPEDLTFALALVEGKPVFAGDTLYSNYFNRNYIVTGLYKEEGYLSIEGYPEGNISVEECVWKQPKKTFTLNGIELPLPTDDNSNVHVEVSYNYDNGMTNTYYPVPREILKYRWSNMEDRDKVMKAITALLDGVTK